MLMSQTYINQQYPSKYPFIIIGNVLFNQYFKDHYVVLLEAFY